MTFEEIVTQADTMSTEEKRKLLDHLAISLITEEAPQLLEPEIWRPSIPSDVLHNLMEFKREKEAK